MNFLYTVEKLKLADIPYFVMEMYTDNPEISDAFHIKTDFILFQKERLCSLLEKKIPARFKKIMFMDGDIIYQNINWYNDMSDLLDKNEVVHGFEKCIRLDLTYKENVDETVSFTYRKQLGTKKARYGPNKIGVSPGGVWGFQRDWYRKIGFFDKDILGGSDTYTALSLGIVEDTYKYPPYIQPAIEDYKAKVKEAPKVGRLPGTIFHLWHGSTANKQYKTRRNIMRGVKDIDDVISTAANGLYRLKSAKLRKLFKRYFLRREDDGLSCEPSGS
jgi:hypothetical protein